jgi:hypothetical protein
VYYHSSLAVRRILLLQFETIKQYFHISTFHLLSSTEFCFGKRETGSIIARERARACVA